MLNNSNEVLKKYIFNEKEEKQYKASAKQIPLSVWKRMIIQGGYYVYELSETNHDEDSKFCFVEYEDHIWGVQVRIPWDYFSQEDIIEAGKPACVSFNDLL